MRVIINADDFGLSIKVNQSIMNLIEAGKISSSTIFGNSEYLDAIAEFASQHKSCSYGVHLNLTQGKSLTNNKKLINAGIIDSNGIFIKENVLKNNVFYEGSIKEAVEEEWTAQVQRVLDAGINVSHLDGHHHCHTWIGLEDVLIRILIKFNLNKVRNRFEYPSSFLLNRIKIKIAYIVSNNTRISNNILLGSNKVSRSLKGNLQDIIFRKEMDKNKIQYPKYFFSYEDHLSKYYYSFADNQKDVIELMCHPGLEKYEKEMQDIIKDAIGLNVNKTYRLISYLDL